LAFQDETKTAGDACLAEFLSSLSFRQPDRVVPSAWYEHAPFAFWLVEQLKPKILVELGVHYGFSFFVFCQTIRMAELSAAAYAVDLWTGDEHAGFYGEEVYQSVEAYSRERYSDVATLMKMAFSEALPYFEDGTVDFLHIDGRHFVDDVTADFKSWLPKLSNRSIVLFHDTNVREREFGVHRLWGELSKTYPSFSFNHGYGLGVLGVGKDLPSNVAKLFNASNDAALTAAIRSAYARLGGAAIKSAAEEVFRERDRLVAAVEREKAEAARNSAQIAALLAELEAARIEGATRDAAKSEPAKGLAQLTDERDRLATALEAALAAAQDGNLGVAGAARRIAEIGAALADAKQASEQLARDRDQLAVELEAAHAAAREHELAIAQNESRLSSIGEELAAAKSEQERIAGDRKNEIDRLSRQLTLAQSALQDREGQIARLTRDLDAARLFLHESQSEVQRLAGELDGAGASLNEKQLAIQRLTGELDRAHLRAEKADVLLQGARSESDGRASRIVELSNELRTATDERVRLQQQARLEMRSLQQQLVDAEAMLARAEGKLRRGSIWTRLFAASPRRAEGELMASGLFDPEWYLRQYPDVAETGRSPAEHYLEEGYFRGYRPNSMFDSRWYLERYEDVRRAGMNPLLHYARYGYREGRDPGPEFQTEFYLVTYPDVRASGLNPLLHYLRHGKDEGRLPARQA